MPHTVAQVPPWQEPIAEPGVIRWLVAVHHGLCRLGWDPYELHVDGLLRAARRHTGLEDFGDPRFIEPLRLRTEFYAGLDELSPLGRFLTFHRLLRPLTNRLLIEAQVKHHPAIHEEQIRRPLFITALPRTGTTFLFNLMAQDPGARPLLYWETHFPVPIIGRFGNDRRITLARQQVTRLNRAIPAALRIHAMDPEGPEECVGLLSNAFLLPHQDYRDLRWHRWIEQAPAGFFVAGYREYETQLKILQAQNRQGRWLLKCPFHLFSLSALLEVFPDASVVQCHRDPLNSIPSFASLSALWHRVTDRAVDAHAIGRATVELFTQLLARGEAARGRFAARHFFDLQYQELIADPIGTVRHIYRHFDYPYSPSFEEAMRAWLAANPQHKHGKHHYRLGDFGLERAWIDERFYDYRTRFEVPSDGVR